MDGRRLDAEARLRAEFRAVLTDLRGYGIPERRLKGKCLAELREMRDEAVRKLMGAPRAA